MVQESLIHALKEEGIEEIAADGEFDHNYHMAIQTLPADDEHPADTIAQVFQKGSNSMIVSYAQQWLWCIIRSFICRNDIVGR